MTRIYLGICGIGNIAGSINGWTDGFTRWCNDHDLCSERFEYTTNPFTRWVRQHWRIKDLITLLNRYQDHPLTIVAHSNGCEVLCQALRKVKICATIHLISPACKASFKDNGLNEAMSKYKVEQLTIHYGGKDEAMRFARLSSWMFGWMGLGFGTLGLKGPTDVDPKFKDLVKIDYRPYFGHSTWFDDKHFEETMRLVTMPQSTP